MTGTKLTELLHSALHEYLKELSNESFAPVCGVSWPER